MTIKRLQLELTSICNLRCPLCHGTRTKFQGPPFFPLDGVLSLLDSLATTIEQVNLYGKIGEPLLHGSLVAIVHAVHERFPKTRSRISTNGILLRDYLAEGLAASPLSTLIVALDGATSESYRRYRRGGDFEKLCRNIANFAKLKKVARQKRPRLIAQFIPMAHNEGESTAVLELARSLGCNGARIKLCGSVQRSTVFRTDGYRPPDGYVVDKTMIASTQFCQCEELYVDCAGRVFPCCHAAAHFIETGSETLLLGNCLTEGQCDWEARTQALKERLTAQGWPEPCLAKCHGTSNKEVHSYRF